MFYLLASHATTQRTISTKTGLRDLIKAHPDQVTLVPVSDKPDPRILAYKGVTVDKLPARHIVTVQSPSTVRRSWSAEIVRKGDKIVVR